MVKLLVKHKANARAKTYDELTPAFLTKDPDILAVSFQYSSLPAHPPWSILGRRVNVMQTLGNRPKVLPVLTVYLADY